MPRSFRITERKRRGRSAGRPASAQRRGNGVQHVAEEREDRELLGRDHGEIDDLAMRGVLHETGTRHEPAAVAMHKETHG